MSLSFSVRTTCSNRVRRDCAPWTADFKWFGQKIGPHSGCQQWVWHPTNSTDWALWKNCSDMRRELQTVVTLARPERRRSLICSTKRSSCTSHSNFCCSNQTVHPLDAALDERLSQHGAFRNWTHVGPEVFLYFRAGQSTRLLTQSLLFNDMVKQESLESLPKSFASWIQQNLNDARPSTIGSVYLVWTALREGYRVWKLWECGNKLKLRLNIRSDKGIHILLSTMHHLRRPHVLAHSDTHTIVFYRKGDKLNSYLLNSLGAMNHVIGSLNGLPSVFHEKGGGR